MPYQDPNTGAISDLPTQAWIDKYGYSINQQGERIPWTQGSVNAVIQLAQGGAPTLNPQVENPSLHAPQAAPPELSVSSGSTSLPLPPVAPASDPTGRGPAAFNLTGGGNNPFAALSAPASTPTGAAAFDPGSIASTIGGVARTIFDPSGSSNVSLGSLGNLDLASLLPALLSSGAALWQNNIGGTAFKDAGNLVQGAETGAGNLVKSTTDQASQGIANNTAQGNNILADLYNQNTAAESPYQTAGAGAAWQLNDALAPGGALNQTMTADDLLKNDPGYQARLTTGLQGIQRQLAAAGLGGSGAAGKELERYAQDYASNEFGNAFNRQQTQEQNLFSRLAGTAGIGETANGQQIAAGSTFGAPQATALENAALNEGGFNVQGSQYKGNADVTGASAQAGAKIDESVQKQQMVQQLLNSVLSLFKPSSISVNGIPPGYNPTPNAPAVTTPTGRTIFAGA